jgi:hypothetical protein
LKRSSLWIDVIFRFIGLAGDARFALCRSGGRSGSSFARLDSPFDSGLELGGCPYMSR